MLGLDVELGAAAVKGAKDDDAPPDPPLGENAAAGGCFTKAEANESTLAITAARKATERRRIAGPSPDAAVAGE